LEHYAEPLLDWDPEKPDAVPPVAVVDARTLAKRATRVASLWPAAEALLEREGLAAQERPKALARVKEAITNTLEDPTGRWILTAHPTSGVESNYTSHGSEGLRTSRIDRWFEHQGMTVIVDYKSGDAPGLAGHSAQLERYIGLLAAIRARPTMAMLYRDGQVYIVRS
jgi:ATP-dependent exoDNAse (exonuclease V) beta subunit